MKKTNVLLWVVQGLLALVFLMAGTTKFTLPVEQLTQGGMPLGFIRFIGVCELLGAIGLIVPSITRIRPTLTPLAAAGLVIIMIGAVSTTLLGGLGAAAVMPFVVGVLAAFVAYGRWRLVPLQSRAAAPQRAVS